MVCTWCGSGLQAPPLATGSSPVCPQCGKTNRSQVLVCKYCGHSFIGPRIHSPREPTPWEQGVRPSVPRARLARNRRSRPRPDHPVAMAGTLLALALLISGAPPLSVLHLGLIPTMVLGLLAVAMGAYGAGFSGFGISAIVIGGLVTVFSLGVLILVNRAQPSLAEPIPPPPGYGFVLQPDTYGPVHLYASTRFMGDAAEARKAVPIVLAYYAERLRPPQWTVLRSDSSSLWVRRTGSNSYLAFLVSGGIVSPPHGGPPVPTLVVQVTAVACTPYVCGDT
jgi:hypothetical protein